MSDPLPTPAAVLEDLRSQERLYERLGDLTSRQLEILEEGGGAGEIFPLVGDKQTAMRELGELEERLAPVRERWRELKEAADESARADLDQALEAVRARLARLIELEERAGKALQSAQDDAGEDLNRLNRGRRRLDAYGDAGRRPAADDEGGRWLDTKE